MAEDIPRDIMAENMEHNQNISNPESSDKSSYLPLHSKLSFPTNTENNDQNQLISNDNDHDSTSQPNQMPQSSIKYKVHGIKVQQKQTEQQEQSKNQYNQLSHKLQSALNKIESTKKHQRNKTYSQSQSTIVRFEQIENKKKKDILRKKEQCQMIIEKELKQKPTIDKNSEKISKEMGHKPIHLRVDKLVEDKKRKFEENQEFKKQKEEQKVQQYLQQLQKFSKKPQQARSYQQYFSEMVRWKERRMQENKQKHELNKDKQLEGMTFKPTLNKKSEMMMASQARIPIQQRPLKKRKNAQQSVYLIGAETNLKNRKS